MKRWRGWIVACAGWLWLAPLTGLDVRGGESLDIPAGEVINDDLICFARRVTIRGTVNGDVYAFGQTVDVEGDVAGTIFGAGRSVEVKSQTCQSVWAFGATVNLSGHARRNAGLFAGAIYVAKSARIEKELIGFGGQLDVLGTVDGRIRGNAGQFRLYGTGGSVDLTVNEDLFIAPEARVVGDLIVRSAKKFDLPDNLPVGGQKKIILIQGPGRKAGGGFPLFRLLLMLGSILCGTVLIALAPRYTRRVATTVIVKTGWSVVAGFVFLITAPLAAVIMIITLVGIPLAAFTLILWGIAIYLSTIVAGIALGTAAIKLVRKPEPAYDYLGMVSGIIILFGLSFIPLLGWVVKLAALVIGSGALVIGTRAYRCELKQ